MPRDTSADHKRIVFEGGTYGEPGFEYFADIGARDFTDDEYEHELTDDQRALMATRPDLYVDKGPASQAQLVRETRRTERQAAAAARAAEQSGEQAAAPAAGTGQADKE